MRLVIPGRFLTKQPYLRLGLEPDSSNIWINENTSAFNKGLRQFFLTVSWDLHAKVAVSLYRCSFRSNVRGKFDVSAQKAHQSCPSGKSFFFCFECSDYTNLEVLQDRELSLVQLGLLVYLWARYVRLGLELLGTYLRLTTTHVWSR